MERGKKLVAMAKKVENEDVKSNLYVEIYPSNNNFCHIEGSVLKRFPYETMTSFNEGISDDVLKLLKNYKKDIVTKNESLENMESDEDPFHETDFDDSDYNPSDNSDMNISSESFQDLAELLKSNLTQTDSSLSSRDNIPTISKKLNRINKNMGKEYFTYRNKKISTKQFQSIGQCSKQCHDKINPKQ